MVAVRVLVRVQVSWLADQSSHHTGLDSGLAHPDIYPIDELQECTKELALLAKAPYMSGRAGQVLTGYSTLESRLRILAGHIGGLGLGELSWGRGGEMSLPPVSDGTG